MHLLFALSWLHPVENFTGGFDLELLFIEPGDLQVISRLEVLGGRSQGDAMREIDIVKILINQNQTQIAAGIFRLYVLRELAIGTHCDPFVGACIRMFPLV